MVDIAVGVAGAALKASRRAARKAAIAAVPKFKPTTARDRPPLTSNVAATLPNIMGMKPLDRKMGFSNLFEITSKLPNYGVGSQLVRSIWNYDDCYWTVTKNSLKPDGKHGKAWGVLTWRGQTYEKAQKISSPLKRQWLLRQSVEFPIEFGRVPTISPSLAVPVIPQSEAKKEAAPKTEAPKAK